jgi:hypothetical protein
MRRGACTDETNVALPTPDDSNATFISSEFAATALTSGGEPTRRMAE